MKKPSGSSSAFTVDRRSRTACLASALGVAQRIDRGARQGSPGLRARGDLRFRQAFCAAPRLIVHGGLLCKVSSTCGDRRALPNAALLGLRWDVTDAESVSAAILDQPLCVALHRGGVGSHPGARRVDPTDAGLGLGDRMDAVAMRGVQTDGRYLPVTRQPVAPLRSSPTDAEPRRFLQNRERKPPRRAACLCPPSRRNSPRPLSPCDSIRRVNRPLTDYMAVSQPRIIDKRRRGNSPNSPENSW